MTFNILTTQRVSCFCQYDRIDDLIPFNLRGDKGPVFRQFLVDEFHIPAVFKFLDPLFVWHVCSPSSEVQDECLSPSRWLSSLIVAFDVFSFVGNLNVSTLFEIPLRYPCRLGHARLSHFLLDAGTRRVVAVSLTFLMQHAPSMASRCKPCSPISHSCEAFSNGPLTRQNRHQVPF